VRFVGLDPDSPSLSLLSFEPVGLKPLPSGLPEVGVVIPLPSLGWLSFCGVGFALPRIIVLISQTSFDEFFFNNFIFSY
jgi:hypothetical protein